MGNCFANNKILAQDHESYIETKVEQMKTSSSSKLETPRKKQCIEKKVRFKIENDDEGVLGSNGNCRSGTVRIRVVMTQEELKKMLSCKEDSQHTSLEQLLGAMKMRGGQISKVGSEYDDGGINSWRPALESIPEDRLIK